MNHLNVSLPTNLVELQDRLEQGETFSFWLTTWEHALFLDEEKRVILRVGRQEQQFQDLDHAVVALLCELGDFEEAD